MMIQLTETLRGRVSLPPVAAVVKVCVWPECVALVPAGVCPPLLAVVNVCVCDDSLAFVPAGVPADVDELVPAGVPAVIAAVEPVMVCV